MRGKRENVREPRPVRKTPYLPYDAIGAGGPTVLQLKDEQEIVASCQTLAEMGFGMTKQLVENIVKDYIQENDIDTPFKDGVPGQDWWQRFRKRWPTLAERKPQHLSKRRAEAANEDTIMSFFDNLEKVFSDNGLNTDPTCAQRLWNCDETAFAMCASSHKVLCKRGASTVHEVGGGSGREYTTVHACCSANGERLPPFILYKGKHLYQRWMEGGPAGAVFGVTESGWMDASNFLSWFEKLFLPAVAHLCSSGVVALFMDGHHSHISLGLIQAARKAHVLLFCLPPNCTHVLQPLDVGVFAPVKKSWVRILKEWKTQTRAQNVSKEVFPKLLHQLWEQSVTPAQCKSGFRACGIFPLSREDVMSKLGPSQAFTHKRTPVESVKSITCDGCGYNISASPLIRTNLRVYFRGVLEVEPKPKASRSKNRIRVEGEVITSDEFLEYFDESRKRTDVPPPTNPLQSDEDDDAMCPVCEKMYSKDTEQKKKQWIGCEGPCERWYHYKCAGYKRMPAKDRSLCVLIVKSNF